MLEALFALLASLFEVFLALLEPLAEFFLGILSLDRSLGESSRLGEAPMAEEGRRMWRNLGLGCLALLLLGAVALAWWRA